MRARALIFAGALALALLTAPAVAGAVTLTQIGGTSFSSPVYVTQPPTGGPLVVVEQAGVIRAISGNAVLPTPFLDIRGRVASSGERGLLSVAFPPSYRRSHLLYVYYTNNSGDIEIDEFKRARHNPYRASVSSRRRVLTISHREASNHNGGQLQFDKSGRLYAGTGDGGGGGDPNGHAQNKNSLLGKLLRIDPRQHGRHRYLSPSSNPYAGRSGRDEIYARGLRNPWRFSIDRVGEKQRLAIGDVGQGAREEIDFETLGGARGANFGWNRFEGFLTYPGGAAAPSQPNPPIFDYDHTGRCSITGGYVVRDPAIPSLAGRYVYADYCGGDLHSLTPRPHTAATDDAAVTTSLLTTVNVSNPSSFGHDVAGHVYVVSHNGPVYRLDP